MSQFHLSPSYKHTFDEMRLKLGMLFLVVSPLIESAVAMEELKTFLQMCFPELECDLSTANSYKDIMVVVRKKCTIINIACLEAIVKHYKIENAETEIASYKSEVNTFCVAVKLDVCENEDFIPDPPSLLKCEAIVFVLEWETDKHTLCEINDLLWKAFGSMAKRVLVKEVKKGNSIIVTCFASCFIVDVLLSEVKKNLDVLKEMGLIKVTIGCHIIMSEGKLKLTVHACTIVTVNICHHSVDKVTTVSLCV